MPLSGTYFAKYIWCQLQYGFLSRATVIQSDEWLVILLITIPISENEWVSNCMFPLIGHESESAEAQYQLVETW